MRLLCVGSGGLLLGLAKLVFLVAAYATSIALTHLISPTVFGRYYVVARLIAVPNMVIIQTLLFAVSRPMAAQREAGLPKAIGFMNGPDGKSGTDDDKIINLIYCAVSHEVISWGIEYDIVCLSSALRI